MVKADIPELRVEDFYAGLEMVDEGTKQHILEHVHSAAILRVRRQEEASSQPTEAPTEPQITEGQV